MLFLRAISRLLKPFYFLLYNPLAWTYDLVAATVSIGRWKTWVRQVLPYLDGPAILELGHGPGHLQAELRRNPGLIAFGIDRSRQMGRIARRRLQNAGLVCELARAEAARLPFASASFQQVVATFPSEYIAAPDTLAQAWRVLVPGGRLIILPLAWITGKRFFDRAAAWLFRVTGESPDWDNRFLEPFRRAGFEPRLEWKELPGSRVLLIIATKIG